MAAAVVIIILIVCVFFIIGGLYVYKMRDQEGDTCTGDDPNAKYTLGENLECRFATCAPGFEINENGTCVFIAEEEAKAELELARNELELKMIALQEENLMSEEEKAQAVADLAAAEARLEDARLALEEEMGRKAAAEALEAAEAERIAEEKQREEDEKQREEELAALNTLQKFQEQAKLVATERVKYDYLGWSVAISGDGNTAIVGAIASYNTDGTLLASGWGTGAAYIFTRSGDSWLQQAKIRASDQATIDPRVGGVRTMAEFGKSVSISGDGNTAIVGSPGGVGGAYIFTRSGEVWSEKKKILNPNMKLEGFGCSVSISGDGKTVIVGALGIHYRAEHTPTGAVYFFIRSNDSGDSWYEQGHFHGVARGADANYNFGWSVSISGDGNTVIVGASHSREAGRAPATNENERPAGAAYIFDRHNSRWFLQATIRASDKRNNDHFGYSVSISGDGKTAIVGAPVGGRCWSTTTVLRCPGAAYIFTRDSGWSQQQKIQASDKEFGDHFGYSVSISKDGITAIVGALNTGSSERTGNAYIFTRSDSSWSNERKIQGSDTIGMDGFGEGVAISGDGKTAIVGAKNEGPKNVPTIATGVFMHSDYGAAYIFN
jgi:hypothetical protein